MTLPFLASALFCIRYTTRTRFAEQNFFVVMMASLFFTLSLAFILFPLSFFSFTHLRFSHPLAASSPTVCSLLAHSYSHLYSSSHSHTYYLSLSLSLASPPFSPLSLIPALPPLHFAANPFNSPHPHSKGENTQPITDLSPYPSFIAGNTTQPLLGSIQPPDTSKHSHTCKHLWSSKILLARTNRPFIPILGTMQCPYCINHRD